MHAMDVLQYVLDVPDHVLASVKTLVLICVVKAANLHVTIHVRTTVRNSVESAVHHIALVHVQTLVWDLVPIPALECQLKIPSAADAQLCV